PPSSPVQLRSAVWTGDARDARPKPATRLVALGPDTVLFDALPPRRLRSLRRPITFEVLEERALAAIADANHLLEEHVFRDLQNPPLLVPQNCKHNIAIDNTTFETLRQDFHDLAKVEGPPDCDEDAGGDIAYDGPHRQETDADHRHGACQECP